MCAGHLAPRPMTPAQRAGLPKHSPHVHDSLIPKKANVQAVNYRNKPDDH